MTSHWSADSSSSGFPSLLSLARGIPSTDLLAVQTIADAARQAVLSDPHLALGYGDPSGHPDLRRWFGERLGVPTRRVLLTNGSLQALAFLAPQLAGAGDWIAVERPTYDLSLSRLAATGATLVGFDVEDDGLDVESLERHIQRFGPPAFCYTIPTFHNPTGISMSGDKRRGLVALSHRHGFWIVEDDPYSQLRFSGTPEPSLLSLDPDFIIHLTSLSKTVAPGLRCGAVAMPEDLVEPTVAMAVHTYIGPGQFAQATAAIFVSSEAYARGLRFAVNELRRRRDRLISGLHLIGLHCDTPGGGYFAWARTGGVDATQLTRVARSAGVAIVPGRNFYLGNGGDDRLRLSWAPVNTAEIHEALNRLAGALEATRRASPVPDPLTKSTIPMIK